MRPVGRTACELICAGLWPAGAVVGRATGQRILTWMPTRADQVALTIDDGPSPSTTPALLDALRHHAARATFFLIGERIVSAPGLAERIIAEGHEVGIHLMHDEPSIRLGRDEFARQMRQVAELLPREAPVRFFRPGSGWFNRHMLLEAAELGYACAMGTPLLVAERFDDPVRVGHRLAGRAHRGAVIVVHEGTPERRGVAPAVDTMLADLGRRGLRAVTLSDLAS